jgi:conjugal transfer pilus assembly protein TraE
MEMDTVRIQRNLLLIVTIFIVIANTVLAVGIYSQKKLVVMVPTLDKEITIGTNYVSEDYLLLRAEQISGLLFNIREDNYLYNQNQLLNQIASQNKEDFKAQLEEFISDVKQKKYYYVFNKQSSEIDNQSLTVTFSGYLETYLIDKKISSQIRTFQFFFVNNGGIVTLTSFEEVKNENSN